MPVAMRSMEENGFEPTSFISNAWILSNSPEVFKLWVATQTWVALALSLGRGLFRDPNYFLNERKRHQI